MPTKRKTTKRKTIAKKTTTKTKKKVNHSKCKPSYRISKAGHLLATEHDKEAGHILATSAKKEKAKRKKRGCLHGLAKRKGKSFTLSAKQKRNLPPALQKAILKYHHGK